MKTGPLNIKDKLYVFFWEVKVFFKKSEYSPKVFCIGYNKTGTTALGEALKSLGYDHSSFNRKVWSKYYKLGNIDKVIRYTAKFESFDDLPWLKEDMIPILDQRFPNSKFIYLSRDETSWKQSIKNWTEKVSLKTVNEKSKFDAYKKHQAFVLDYFKNRQNDFISLQINDPKGMQKLSIFLNKTSHKESFEVFNKT